MPEKKKVTMSMPHNDDFAIPDTPPCSPMIELLIVDDHTVLREGLMAIFKQETDIKVVGETGRGKDAVELWVRHRPDITLMDLRMPDQDGVSTIIQIRSIDPQAKIIMLTTYDGDEDIYRGMRAGAKAYLLKDVRREELLSCVRDVHAGRTCITPIVATKLAERMSMEELTPRELEILRIMATGKSNKQIAALLFIGEATVKSHVQAMLKKLNVLSRTEAIAVAHHRGLLRS